MSGEMRVLFVLGQSSAEIARVGWASMWCGEMRVFFGCRNRLQRSCMPDAQTWDFVRPGARRRPFARNHVESSDARGHDSQMAISVGKLQVLTVRPKRSAH